MSPGEGKQIPDWTVYAFALAFLLFLVGTFFSTIVVAVGGIIAILVGFIAYTNQGKSGAAGLPALHRELAKTHCGQCGAPMRSNMTFCPSCGARQTPS